MLVSRLFSRARQAHVYRYDGRLFSSTTDSIGFVGLGNMGLPMATNLAKNWSVIAFDANEKAMKIAQEAGIQRAPSLEQVGASSCSVIFTMLPGCSAVDHVTPILLDSVDPASSTVFVDCSTVRTYAPS